MTAGPALIPVTRPVAGTIVIVPLGVLHVPPGVASVTVIVDPTHTLVGPPIGAGSGLIVIVTLPVINILQPVEVIVALTV
jgi:hypothetical protein